MAEYHINQKSGGDANAGTSKLLAWETLDNLLISVLDGDIIYIYGGVYAGVSLPYALDITIIGIGYVEITGEMSHSTFGLNESISGIVHNCNVIFGSGNTNSPTPVLNCVFKGANTETWYATGTAHQMSFEKCSFSNTDIGYGTFGSLRYISVITPIKSTFYNTSLIALNNTLNSDSLFDSCKLLANTWTVVGLIENIDNGHNLYNSKIVFDSAYYGFAGEPKTWDWSLVPVATSSAQLRTQYETETGLVPSTTDFDTLTFDEPFYIDSDNDNFALDIENTSNSGLIERGQGYQVALGWLCNSTNFSLYTTDSHALGLVNVTGAIDDVDPKLYRTSSGATNHGVFEGVAKEFSSAKVINLLEIIGDLINVGQLSSEPSDFDDYQVDFLLKTSDTLSSSELEADTSLSFYRFKYDRNEGLRFDGDYGDGNALFNSANGYKIVCKSIKPILILKDI